ncbi:MAG TPA: manganese efflux pump [Streptosporangiaceae bacterium]|nr:manganese efflux pump [Streptosporangiaceae bacterium]
MTAVLLVAVSVGLDNFAVAAAFGMTGAGGRRRLEVALIFGLFAGLMPLLGLALGARLSDVLGDAADPAAACVLGLAGLAGLVSAIRERRSGSAPAAAERPAVPGAGSARLWLTAAVLSLDSLVVGLALGAYRVPLLISVATFAIVGVGMSLLGVEVGRRVSAALGEYSGLVGSVALIGVGVALGFGVL